MFRAYSTFSARRQRREQVELLEHEADRRAAELGQPVRPGGVDLAALDRAPPRSRRQHAAEDGQQRRLARPRGPSSATISPRSSRERRPLEDGDRLGPLAEALDHILWLPARSSESSRTSRNHAPSIRSRRRPSPARGVSQPRKTSAGSSAAILRNEITEAPRQSASVPTKTDAANAGVRISFRSIPAMHRPEALGHERRPAANPTTAAIAACLAMIA